MGKFDEKRLGSDLQKAKDPVIQRISIFPAYLMEKNSETWSVPQLQEDRISKLPDDILVDILSTLQFKEAAQTSVLSHRWLNLWTHVPLLHFDATKDQRRLSRNKLRIERPVFANWVNHVLHSHKNSNLQEFRIFFDLDKSYQSEIDKWLEYAFDRGLQMLELDLSRFDILGLPNDDSCSFPNQLLDQTTQVGIRLAAKVGFSGLKVLYFTAVNISGEAIESLLLKCPLLEDLRVIGSRVLINLVVSGPSLVLKHLEITYCYCAESITFSNINIVFLKVSTRKKGCILLINLPMLTEVWIKGDYTNNNILFSQMSCSLPQLTVLTLEALQPEPIMDLYKLPELQNLRRLLLVAHLCGDKSLTGLTSLIDSCPRLVEFALMLHPVDQDMLERERKKATEQSLKGLKVFELYGYHGNTNENELIMFFIDNAAALEKLVIDPHFVYNRRGAVEPNEAEIEREKESRKHAIANFEGVVPPHVELVVL